MDNFKAGETVECINVDGVSCVTLGKEYEITGVGKLFIEIKADDNSYMEYAKTRFKHTQINYMYVWDENNEKDAIKREVISQLDDNPRKNSTYTVVTLNSEGVVTLYEHCKSIEQWEADNKPKYRPFTQEEFREHRDKWLKHIQKSTVEYKITKTLYDYVFVDNSRCTYQDLLDSFIFEDGTPCGVKE